MAATSTFTVRLPTKLKKDAEKIFEEVGLDMPTAFRTFLKATVRRQGLPYQLTTVDENGFTPEEVAEIQQAREEARNPENWIGPFHDAKSLIASLHTK